MDSFDQSAQINETLDKNWTGKETDQVSKDQAEKIVNNVID